MSTTNQPLARAFAQLQRATTTLTRSRAAGLVYTHAHQALAQRCCVMLSCIAPTHWDTGEDLASAALLTLLRHPDRAQACTNTTADGILAFLRAIAFYDLLDARDVRAQRTHDVRTERLSPALLRTLASAPAGAESECSNSAFWTAYICALRTLPPMQQRMWILVVEQEMPMADAALVLGVNRTTVWRQVQAATARLRVLLEPALAARSQARRVAPAPRPVAPPRTR